MKFNLPKNSMQSNFIFTFLTVFLLSPLPLIAADDCRTGEPRVFFIAPKDGDKLKSPIQVTFGIENFNIAPAGIDKCDSGHHHLIINAELPDPNLPIPSSNNYIHFGAGQTETEIILEPGKHSLRLLMGNYAHLPQFYSEEIEVEVLEIK